MSNLLLGQLVALITSMLWASTSVLFSISGRRVGSQVVNLMRLLLALGIILVMHRLTQNHWLPTAAEPWRWGWLLLSGVIGLTLGDAALFQALVYLGPRLTMLVMSLVPVVSSLLAWGLLGETLGFTAALAVPVTVVGVAWVVFEHGGNDEQVQAGKFVPGILFALGGMLGQSLGLITSRLGLVGDFPALSATLIRTISATAMLWVLPLVSGRVRQVIGSFWQDRGTMWLIIGGTIVGPVLGVLFSLIAIQNAPIGIASTLMSLTPIMILPIVYVVFKERISGRAFGGTLIALAGVALIFLPKR